MYFFGYNSIVDKDLKPEVGKHVNFDLHRRNEKEQVAVRIRSLIESSTSNKCKKDDDFIDAVVNWYKPEKRYGYVTCENSCDAFLHLNILLKAGVDSVKPKQLLKVKLVEDKYPGKKAVSEVMVLSNSGHNPAKAHPRQPKYPPANFKLSSNDLTEIPSSTSNEKRPGSAHSSTSSHSISLAPSARMHFRGPPPLHSRMDRPQMQHAPFNSFPRMPNSPMHPAMMPRYPNFYDERPRTPNREAYFNRPPRSPNGIDFYHGPSGASNWEHGTPRIPNGDFYNLPYTGRPPMRPNIFNGPPMMPNGDFFNRSPRAQVRPNRMPNRPDFLTRHPKASNTEKRSKGPPTTPTASLRPTRQSRPSAPNQNINSMHIARPRYSPRNFSKRHHTPVTNPEYAKIKQQISQKQNLLRTINVSKLPDAGQRLRNQIKDLQVKMENLNMNDDVVETEIAKSKKDVVVVPDLFYDHSCYDKSHLQKSQKDNALGGRSPKLLEIQQVVIQQVEFIARN